MVAKLLLIFAALVVTSCALHDPMTRQYAIDGRRPPNLRITNPAVSTASTPPPILDSPFPARTVFAAPQMMLASALVIAGTIALVPNTISALPLIPPKDLITTNCFFNVTTLEAGRNARIAIYKDRGDGVSPGVLLADSGLMSLAAVANVNAAMVVQLSRGLKYWICYNTDSAGAARAASLANTSIIGILATQVVGIGPQYSLSRAFAFAAFPADESAQAYIVASPAQHPILSVN